MIRLFVIWVFILLFSCSKQVEDSKVASKKPIGNLPENKIWDMDVMITNSGKLKAKFKGGVVIRDNLGNSKYSESLVDSGLIIQFYEKEVQTGELVSDRGWVNDLKGIFKAIDNVIFKSTSGYVLYTDTLTWLRNEAVITTDSPVMMVKNETDTLYGDGFTADDKLESYEIKNPRGKAIIDKKEVE